MNVSRIKNVAGVAAAVLALAFTTAPSSHAVNSPLRVTEKIKVNETALPSVSAHAGVAPVIGKPVGAAPTTLIKKDIIVGKGKTALSSSSITAKYVLMSWKTGQVLQSSWPNSFPTALANVIPGWQQGIPGMKVGGRRLLVIPPALAYGVAGGQGIGPNETLIFVVDLLSVK